MNEGYLRLLEKVDATTRTLGDRLADAMSCGPGCASCCHVELTVVGVEADAVTQALEELSDESRRRVAARADVASDRCVMLDEDDLCAIFAARPLVCRTQGLPLLYPEQLIPVAAVLARTDRGAITACPLNFRERTPTAADAIDAERLDAMLGLVERLALGPDDTPRERRSLRDLARLR